MSNAIPPEMLEAATVRYMLNQGHAVKTVKLFRQNDDPIWQNAQRHARLMLEAAGVGEMLAALQDIARIAARGDVNIQPLLLPIGDAARAVIAHVKGEK